MEKVESQIRVLVVEADPGRAPATRARLSATAGIEVVGVAHNRQAARRLLETTRPDVLLVDLMLAENRSIEIIRHARSMERQVPTLALVPADPPHEGIILAVQAGALGYVCRDAAPSEFAAALQQVHAGEPWLPVHATYEILQESAGELEVSARERRDRLGQIVLALIPLGGVLAGLTALLWREYWGEIGVRVVDLGIDPTTRMIDVVVSLLLLVGVLGPLLYVGVWVQAIAAWIGRSPRWAHAVAKGRDLRLGRLPIGRLILNRRVAQAVMALSILAITSTLAVYAPLPVILIVGPAIGVALLASLLDLERDLPPLLRLPPMTAWRVFAIAGVFMLVLLIALSAEVVIWGPDLRTDGLHGVLAPVVFGFNAQPVLVSDLEGEDEPLGALYLGGNADLYVLYDPCEETVRFVPVGSSEVKFVDQVPCPAP
jgi:DNA-binding NarL/FixJ family response regulator